MTNQDMMLIHPKPVPGALCRREQFGAMLVAGNLPILNLNDDAYRIWELCDGKRTIAEIEVIINEDFETTGLRERMLEFFRYCMDNGLLVDAIP